MSYTRFSDVMLKAYPAYKWEPITVTTNDDYKLMLFHVWNEEKRKELGAQGPILFQHGTGQDGVNFLSEYGMTETLPGPAVQIQFADLGYDVYLGNNRGTEYSLGHADFSTASDNPSVFWDFTLDGLALDVLANSKAMTENATGGNSKGWYFGYSQGTIQALIALAKYET